MQSPGELLTSESALSYAAVGKDLRSERAENSSGERDYETKQPKDFPSLSAPSTLYGSLLLRSFAFPTPVIDGQDGFPESIKERIKN